MRKDQNGHVLLVVIGVVVLLSLGGLVLWRMQDSKQNANTEMQAAPQPPPTVESQPQEESVAEEPLETGLEIKELGIRATPKSDVPGLTYSFYQFETAEGSKVLSARLSTKELAKRDSDCGAKEAPLGALGRIEGKYPNDPNADNSGGLLIKQFPTFHIDYASPQAPCSQNESVQNETIKTLFKVNSQDSWTITLLK